MEMNNYNGVSGKTLLATVLSNASLDPKDIFKAPISTLNETTAQVVSFDNDNLFCSEGEILASGDKKILRIFLSNGKYILCSSGCLILTAEYKWIEAKNLLKRFLKTYSGNPIYVIGISHLGITEKVYSVAFENPTQNYMIMIDEAEGVFVQS